MALSAQRAGRGEGIENRVVRRAVGGVVGPVHQKSALEEDLRVADERRSAGAGLGAVAHLAAHPGAVDGVERAAVGREAVAGDVRAGGVAAEAPLANAQHVLVGHAERGLEERVVDGVAHHRRHPAVVGHVERTRIRIARGAVVAVLADVRALERCAPGQPAGRGAAAEVDRAGVERWAGVRAGASVGGASVRRPSVRWAGIWRAGIHGSLRSDDDDVVRGVIGYVEVAVRSDEESHRRPEPRAKVRSRARHEAIAAGVGRQRPDVPVGVVTEVVAMLERCRPGRAVQEDATGDALAVAIDSAARTSVQTEVLRVDAVSAVPVRAERTAGGDRIADAALAVGPAVVLPLGHQVDLLVGHLTHVADPEVPGLRVEGEPERVAKSPGPDLGSRHAGEHHRDRVGRAGSGAAGRDGRAHQRVVGRDGAVEVDAEDLPVRLGETGSGVVPDVRIRRRWRKAGITPGVAHAHVELPVGPDAQAAAVVVGRAAQVVEQHRLRAGERVRVGQRHRHHPVPVQVRPAGGVGARVVEEQGAVAPLAEQGVELDAEQPLLAVAVHREGAGLDDGPARLAHHHLARLPGDHHPAVGEEAEIGDLVQTGGEGGEGKVVRRSTGGERLGRGSPGHEGRRCDALDEHPHTRLAPVTWVTLGDCPRASGSHLDVVWRMRAVRAAPSSPGEPLRRSKRNRTRSWRGCPSRHPARRHRKLPPRG